MSAPPSPATHRRRHAREPEPTRPEIEFPGGEPPADLVVEDVTVGDGPEATAAAPSRATTSASRSPPARSSTRRGTAARPLDFRLGVGQVIAGWDQGIEGMKVGGRRRLTIPPHLAYGDRGAGGAIKPGETLIFVVDLVGVR